MLLDQKVTARLLSGSALFVCLMSFLERNHYMFVEWVFLIQRHNLVPFYTLAFAHGWYYYLQEVNLEMTSL